MGKTYKDRDKYDRKRREREGEDNGFRQERRENRKRFYEQIDPDDLDAYGEWDDNWDR